jgi:hypothetical protein
VSDLRQPGSSAMIHNQWFRLVSIKIIVALIDSIHDIEFMEWFGSHEESRDNPLEYLIVSRGNRSLSPKYSTRVWISWIH